MKSCVECEVDAGFICTVCYDCVNRDEIQKDKEGGGEKSRGEEEVRLAMLPVL